MNPTPQRLPPPILVDTPAAFAAMMVVLRAEPAIALDTESDSLYRYFYKVCLIQISIPTSDYVLDPLPLNDLAPLGALMADPAVEKVIHAAENDILVLKRDWGFGFANIFDTMMAARILGRRQVGLAALLAEHFGVTLDKRTQLTDWGHRPLTADQLSYGRLDSHYLLALRDLLGRDLQTRRRWREAQEAFAALADVVYTEKPFDPDGFWRNKGARDLRPGELAILRELYLWRDTQARTLDRPPFKVLGDETLIRLSQDQPRRLVELALSPWQARAFGPQVLEAINRGRGAPPPQPPVRPSNGTSRPDPATLTRFDRLRAWRASVATERGVEADVVLNNEVLMTIARIHPATLADLVNLHIMGPWKLEEYGADLLRVTAT